MTIYCTQDGTSHPDGAKYCMKCGHPLHGDTRPSRIERKELEFKPGNGWGFTLKLPQHLNREINQLRKNPLRVALATNRDLLQEVTVAVGDAFKTGWEPEAVIDLNELYNAGIIYLEDQGRWTHKGAEGLWRGAKVNRIRVPLRRIVRG